ncbi:MAG: DUF2680 domain-containing protein [Eubacterium sp.]|nr:DUF2680 domain-containing protein [Eubacterium sp.]
MAALKLGEGLKNILLAGVGAVATTAEKSKEIVDQLVEKGELTVEQGKVMNEELKRNLKEKVKDNVTVVVKEDEVDADTVVARMDSMSPEELQAIKDKLAHLEAKDAEDAETAE